MYYQGCLKFMSSLSWSDWRKSQNSIEDGERNDIWVAVSIFFRILLLVEDFVDSFFRWGGGLIDIAVRVSWGHDVHWLSRRERQDTSIVWWPPKCQIIHHMVATSTMVWSSDYSYVTLAVLYFAALDGMLNVFSFNSKLKKRESKLFLHALF